MTLLLKGTAVVTPPTPVINAPTGADLLSWSVGMATLVAQLDDATAQLSAAQAAVTAAQTQVAAVRAVIALYSQGAKNWSTVVK